MKNKLYLLLAVVMLLATGCGSLYESNKDGYTQVNSVNGVVFDMPSNFLSQTTAITNITEDTDYSSGTYLYKNGRDMYLMFNINDVIVAVQSNTSFNMKNAEEKYKDIENSGICGVWITPDKKMNYEEQTKNGVYKMIADVKADISVTSTVYGEFYGKFATVQYDDFECSIFAGVPYNQEGLSNKQSSILEHVVKSLTVDKTYVDLFGGKKETVTTESVENNSLSEDTTEEIIVNENTEIEEIIVEDIETEEILGEEVEDTEVEEIIVEDTEIEEIVIEENEEDTDVSEAIQETEVAEETETPDEDKEGVKEEKDTFITDNQSEATNGYSDIYHMLTVGRKGFLNALNNNGKDLTETFVVTNKLYTKQDAVDIIKEYCKTKECLYKYEDAPAGYSWHVMEYTLEKDPTELYVNVKILGFDGEKLRFRGIAAPSRTYDIFSFKEKTEAGYEKVYCYYAVPNGCKEYMLEFGTRFTETGGTACYKISNY